MPTFPGRRWVHADGVAPAPLAVLAGGLGTRLRAITGDLPKPLVPVAGRPFIAWLLLALRQRGLRRALLCTGYGHAAIAAALGDGTELGLQLCYSVEQAPLGTAGAVAQALPQLADPFLLLNGDTYVVPPWRRLLAAHRASGAAITLGVARMPDVATYGEVEVGPGGVVRAFREKAGRGGGLVSAGVYVISHRGLAGVVAGRPTSLERDVLPPLAAAGHVRAYRLRARMYDIGTPERLDLFRNLVQHGLVHSQ
jgi:D-glycero-alpha-D-manno-heptose 1-phosphate guanylyltransferase